MNQNKIFQILFYLFGMILTLPVIIFPPFITSPDWDKTTIFRSLLAIIIGVFIWQTYKNNNFYEIWQKIKSVKTTFLLLILVFTSFLLSTLFSQDISFSFWGSPYRAGGFLTFSFYLLFSVLLFLIINPVQWKKLLDWSLITGWLVAIIAIFQALELFGFTGGFKNDPPSTTGNSIFLAIYLLLLIFLAIGLFFKINSKNYHRFYRITIIFFFLVILISSARAVYLGALAGLLFFLFFLPKRVFLNNNLNPSWSKIKKIRIITLILVLLASIFIIYINTAPVPDFLKNTRVISRLSFKLVIEESRFPAWKIIVQAVKEKPILGWGPENLQMGFDKYYDPALPQMAQLWWDKAHNIFLDTAAATGAMGLFVYLLFFASIFWRLQKIKNEKNEIIAHALQSAFMAYFVANFFSFDSFVTYIILFLLVGYSFTLIQKDLPDSNKLKINLLARRSNKFIFFLIIIVILIFILFFNILPYSTGRAVGLAEKLTRLGNCKQASDLMEKTIKTKGYVSTYTKTNYGEILKKCALASNVKDGLQYAKRGMEVLQDVVISKPKSTGTWLFLSIFGNIILEREPDINKQKELSTNIKEYIKRGLELSPKRQEFMSEKAKNFLIEKNYQAVLSTTADCLKIYDKFGPCYWYSGVANIYLGNQAGGKQQIKLAREKGAYGGSLIQLANAYESQKNYPDLKDIYQLLVDTNPKVVEYRASLAFTLEKLGDYANARIQALEVLKLAPEEKEEVMAFIKILPYPYNKSTEVKDIWSD